MNNDTQNLHQMLLEAFAAESVTIVESLTATLNDPTVDFMEVSRLAHTLKGAARACGVDHVEQAAYELEMYTQDEGPSLKGIVDLFNTLTRHLTTQEPCDPQQQNDLVEFPSKDDGNYEIGVLIVDDSPTVRAHHRASFSQPGFRVAGEAVNGNDALSLLADAPETVDVVVSDLEMPRANGIDLTHAIRASDNPQVNSLPIVMVTSRTEPEFRQEALKAGVTRYLSKALLRTSEIASHVREVART